MTLLALSNAVWGTIAAIAGPSIAFATWFLARDHNEGIEDSDSMARAITAVTDANSSLTATALTIVAPLQVRIAQLEKQHEDGAAAREAIRQDMDEMMRQMRILIDYVHTLRRQIVDLGGLPIDFPKDLEGFTFD